MKRLFAVGSAAVLGVLFSVLNASAVLTSLIDFTTIATDVTPLMTTAVTAGAGIGVLLLAAYACWRMFKRFMHG